MSNVRKIALELLLGMDDLELAAFLAKWVKPSILEHALDIIKRLNEWDRRSVDITTWEHVRKEGEPGPRFGP